MASPGLTDFERYIAGTATVIIAVVALSGNSLVFCAFFKFKKLRTPTNYFIINLAVFDFLVGCIPVSFWASYLLTGQPKRVSGEFDVVYWLWECFDVLCATGSATSLTFIAVDRYLCVKDALRYHALVTASRVYSSIIFIWVFSLIPPILSYLTTRGSIPAAVFMYYAFTSGLVVPVCIMAFCYVNIFLETVRLNREMKSTQSLGTFVADSGAVNLDYCHSVAETERSSIDEHYGNTLKADNAGRSNGKSTPLSHDYYQQNEQTESQPDKISSNSAKSAPEDAPRHNSCSRNSLSIGWGDSKSTRMNFMRNPFGKHHEGRDQPNSLHRNKAVELKAAKILGFIMGAFLLTWTPFIMVVMIYLWYPQVITLRLSTIVKCLHYSNSGLNPFLYTILNKSFREAFIKLLLCRSRGNN